MQQRSPCVFFFVLFCVCVNPFNSLPYGWRRWKKKMNEISFLLTKSTISSFIRIIYVVLNAFNDDRDWPLLLHLLLVSVKGFQTAWRPSFKIRFSFDYCRYRKILGIVHFWNQQLSIPTALSIQLYHTQNLLNVFCWVGCSFSLPAFPCVIHTFFTLKSRLDITTLWFDYSWGQIETRLEFVTPITG